MIRIKSLALIVLFLVPTYGFAGRMKLPIQVQQILATCASKQVRMPNFGPIDPNKEQEIETVGTCPLIEGEAFSVYAQSGDWQNVLGSFYNAPRDYSYFFNAINQKRLGLASYLAKTRTFDFKENSWMLKSLYIYDPDENYTIATKSSLLYTNQELIEALTLLIQGGMDVVALMGIFEGGVSTQAWIDVSAPLAALENGIFRL